MSATWKEPWTEIWSAGYGRDRSYCGIAETEEGFAVDVFHGDTCVASTVHASRDEAEREARRARGKYMRTTPIFQTPDLRTGASAGAH